MGVLIWKAISGSWWGASCYDAILAIHPSATYVVVRPTQPPPSRPREAAAFDWGFVKAPEESGAEPHCDLRVCRLLRGGV